MLNGDKAFAVVRVLVVEAGSVHVCFYANEYKHRPGHVDPKSLKFEIGHVPLDEQGFRNWQPVLLYEEPVKESELEGYRLWKTNHQQKRKESSPKRSLFSD